MTIPFAGLAGLLVTLFAAGSGFFKYYLDRKLLPFDKIKQRLEEREIQKW